MSTLPWLNLLSLALSIFNVIILLWLGLTILLNAERRVWGLWLAHGLFFLELRFHITE